MYECPYCGGKMKQSINYDDMLECTECGIEIEKEDYGLTSEEIDDKHMIDIDGDTPPPYCDICGGPWPQCTTSCKLYD